MLSSDTRIYLNWPHGLKCLLIPSLFKLGSKHNLLTACGHDPSSHLVLLRRPPLCASDLWEKPGAWSPLTSLSVPCLSAPPLLPWRQDPELRAPQSTHPPPHLPSPHSPHVARASTWGSVGQHSSDTSPAPQSVGTTGAGVTFRFVWRCLYKLFFSKVLICLSLQVSLSREASSLETNQGSPWRRPLRVPPSPFASG